MFNVIDLATGWKVDLIIRNSRAFSQEEFTRRQRVSLRCAAGGRDPGLKSGVLLDVRLRVTGKWLANICIVSAPATFVS